MTANLTCLQSPLRVMASGVRLSGFDPRSRAGSDAGAQGPFQLMPSFDPRSRAGSDRVVCAVCDGQGRFDPRSRAGSDFLGSTTICPWTLFRSTLPRGERRDWRTRIPGRRWFRSTLPRGERLKSGKPAPTATPVSIHAPARGATLLLLLVHKSLVFRSTLPRGERHLIDV